MRKALAIGRCAEIRRHAQEEPLTKLDRPDRVRTYALPTGERILGLINPVENEDNFLKIILNSAPVMLLAIDKDGRVTLLEGHGFEGFVTASRFVSHLSVIRLQFWCNNRALFCCRC